MAPADPDKPMQSWDARRYADNARFVSDLGLATVELLAPRRGERILDLGCGDGALSRKLIDAGATVVGIDSSPQLIAAARAAGVDARLMNGQRLTFHNEFDAVFSNAALHWMPDAAAVVAGVAQALRPGGRFVGEFGGHGNVAAICTALLAARRLCGFSSAAGPRHVPWYFPTAAEYARVLIEHGFAVDSIELFPRPTPLPTGMAGWLETFAHPLLSDVPAERRPVVLEAAVELLAPTLRDSSGQWTADYVRLRFHARRPTSRNFLTVH
jgi:trans-aconitate methyltransferase